MQTSGLAASSLIWLANNVSCAQSRVRFLLEPAASELCGAMLSWSWEDRLSWRGRMTRWGCQYRQRCRRTPPSRTSASSPRPC